MWLCMDLIHVWIELILPRKQITNFNKNENVFWQNKTKTENQIVVNFPIFITIVISFIL